MMDFLSYQTGEAASAVLCEGWHASRMGVSMMQDYYDPQGINQRRAERTRLRREWGKRPLGKLLWTRGLPPDNGFERNEIFKIIEGKNPQQWSQQIEAGVRDIYKITDNLINRIQNETRDGAPMALNGNNALYPKARAALNNPNTSDEVWTRVQEWALVNYHKQQHREWERQRIEYAKQVAKRARKLHMKIAMAEDWIKFEDDVLTIRTSVQPVSIFSVGKKIVW